MSRLRKRTHIYCQHPQVYEIAGCPNHEEQNYSWSEYEQRLWCFICEVDFEPEHWGIFDGPIPMGLCELMGISFDRINIKTHKRVVPNFADEKAMARYDRTWNRPRDKERRAA